MTITVTGKLVRSDPGWALQLPGWSPLPVRLSGDPQTVDLVILHGPNASGDPYKPRAQARVPPMSVNPIEEPQARCRSAAPCVEFHSDGSWSGFF